VTSPAATAEQWMQIQGIHSACLIEAPGANGIALALTHHLDGQLNLPGRISRGLPTVREALKMADFQGICLLQEHQGQYLSAVLPTTPIGSRQSILRVKNRSIQSWWH
jgi:hypothetical protein